MTNSEWETRKGWRTHALHCAAYLLNPRSRQYELSHVRSGTMAMSPFAVPLSYDYEPTFGPENERGEAASLGLEGQSVWSAPDGAQMVVHQRQQFLIRR